jgi:hypothetical protein
MKKRAILAGIIAALLAAAPVAAGHRWGVAAMGYVPPARPPEDFGQQWLYGKPAPTSPYQQYLRDLSGRVRRPTDRLVPAAEPRAPQRSVLAFIVAVAWLVTSMS